MAFISLRSALSDWLKKRKLKKPFNENKTLPVKRAGRKKVVT